MKIIQEESVYENGEKFYCINFDDGTYICLAENEYYDLLKIIENGNQSDLNNFVDKSSARNRSNTSGSDISNIGMFFSIILGIGMIWIFNKTFQWIPLAIGIIIFAFGLFSLIVDGFINHKKPHIVCALLYSISSAIIYFLIMVCLLFLISFSHLCFNSVQFNNITEASGFDRNVDIGFIPTIIGAFLIGAYYEVLGSK